MPQSGSTEQGAFRRLVNLGLLIGGFGAGQGSIFLGQSYLVATGRTELLALFGTHFSFAMLGIIAVEAGSLTILAAQITRQLHSGGEKLDVWRLYWETTAFRVTMATLLIVGSLLTVAFLPLPVFSRAYVMSILPAFAVWAFNGAGFLDGLQKSGVSGLTGAIAYVASAIALVLSLDLDSETAGYVTGGALSLGYIVTVLSQFIALSAFGWRPTWARPSAVSIRKAFIEESSMLMGLLPGQLYFRAQLAISSLFLGATPTAMLVYAKQIIGAASQVAAFARRIEFPRMVQALERNPSLGVGPLMRMQKGSFAIAGVLFAGVVAASFVVKAFASGFSVEAWTFLALFSVTILSESIGQGLVQCLFARGRIHGAGLARLTAVVAATIFGYALARSLGPQVFILSDLLSHMLVISLTFYWLKRGDRT
ncbi:hypothetical protein M2360_003390 [Rhizobium sp. SG_E_25_P2]|uniref:hypothetical protein n=1 Tax=Rhizobium sp. SG_E_25_P2 TaxID=2879942 RepID=UPI0024766336|nr:hypothetical protein [Rhizobium sp. SG_E_25_P2]MDH6267987.1 hypothetical protein [Rhizobium sp. SG_E_25_P2]